MILKDNTKYSAPTQLSLNECMRLERIANCNVQTLVDDSGNSLFIFPQSSVDCKDKIKDLSIIQIHKTSWKNGQCVSDNLKTGNLAGFIGFDNQSLTIRSRFSADGFEDYFLRYMLERILNLNLMDLPFGVDKDNMLDLLVILFPNLLNNALAQGIYKAYCSHDYNDANVRGPIDMKRHIRMNIPFQGRVAYHSRELNHDNPVTELIRHAIEVVSRTKIGRMVLEHDEQTRESVASIIAATGGYNSRNREKVIRSNLKIGPHPFYSKYAPLQRLCLRILRYEKLKYDSRSDNRIYGLLFDVSYLWEEYLSKVLTPIGFIHPDNRKSRGRICLTSTGKYPRYPDFYIKMSDGFVIDAKYKKEIDSVADINQMITYMYRLKARHGILVKPSFMEKPVVAHSLLGHGLSNNAELKVYTFSIPQKIKGYEEFKKEIEQSERQFVKFISEEAAD